MRPFCLIYSTFLVDLSLVVGVSFVVGTTMLVVHTFLVDFAWYERPVSADGLRFLRRHYPMQCFSISLFQTHPPSLAFSALRLSG